MKISTYLIGASITAALSGCGLTLADFNDAMQSPQVQQSMQNMQQQQQQLQQFQQGIAQRQQELLQQQQQQALEQQRQRQVALQQQVSQNAQRLSVQSAGSSYTPPSSYTPTSNQVLAATTHNNNSVNGDYLPGGAYNNCYEVYDKPFDALDDENSKSSMIKNTCEQSLHFTWMFRDGHDLAAADFNGGEEQYTGNSGDFVIAHGGGYYIAICPIGYSPVEVDGSSWSHPGASFRCRR